MDIALTPDEVVPSLWREYRKQKEYKDGLIKAIPAHHPLVEKREFASLYRVYLRFVAEPLKQRNTGSPLLHRSYSDWINEWKSMHNEMFKWILVERGTWRKIDVRFGYPGDEDLHRIPSWKDVPKAIGELADELNHELLIEERKLESIFTLLARFHYQFVRIHPFPDGNGRIARVVTDQIALHYWLPPAMAGYPRHNKHRRQKYHEAIRSCVNDPACTDLAMWIKGYVDQSLRKLA
jgi:Fic family protein